MAAFTQDFFSSRRNYSDGNTRIGEDGRLWYDSISNTIRVGNGTPGGKIVGGVSNGSGGELPVIIPNGFFSFDGGAPDTNYTGAASLDAGGVI